MLLGLKRCGPSRLLSTVGMAFGILGLLAPAAIGHGSMSDPVSRSLKCYLEGPENPRSAACKAAIAIGGTQPFYDWMEVNVSNAAGRHRELIRDGRLCGADRQKYAGIDLARRDWPTTELIAGDAHRFLYRASTPHGGNFKLYVTRDGYDPRKPLRWDDLESKPFLKTNNPPLLNGDYAMDAVLPTGKSGRHVIYSIWQRFDSPEAFYSCSDVVFRDLAAEANLRVAGRDTQKFDRKIRVDVTCLKPCHARAEGRAIIKGGHKPRATLKLKKVRAKIRAGRTVPLRLVPKGRKAKRILRKRVKHGAGAKARIAVTAVDGSGVSSTEKLTVRLTWADPALSVNRSDHFPKTTDANPASDPENRGRWTLRNDLSDEFDGTSIDSSKWFLAGSTGNKVRYPAGSGLEDGSAADWVGRAPSAFSPDNVRLAGGQLYLRTAWAPDAEVFPVLEKDGSEMVDDDCGCIYENYTVGGLISRSNLNYGYAEIRSRAAPLPLSSAFWIIGNHFEIDIFETIGAAGDGPDGSGEAAPYVMSSTIHNWDVGGLQDNGVGRDSRLGFSASEGLHTYGVQWSEDKVVFYADGKKQSKITAKQVGRLWNSDFMHVWADNETFEWEGLPSKSMLPADYVIDHIRVWQR